MKLIIALIVLALLFRVIEGRWVFHADVTWDFGPLRYTRSTTTASTKNFAGLFPWIDLLFGTLGEGLLTPFAPRAGRRWPKAG